MPQIINALLEQFGTALWAQGLQLSIERLSAEREALEKARQEIESQRQEAAGLADQLSSELEATWQEANALRQQIDVAQSTVKAFGDQLREHEQASAVAHAPDDDIRNRATQLTELAERRDRSEFTAPADTHGNAAGQGSEVRRLLTG